MVAYKDNPFRKKFTELLAKSSTDGNTRGTSTDLPIPRGHEVLREVITWFDKYHLEDSWIDFALLDDRVRIFLENQQKMLVDYDETLLINLMDLNSEIEEQKEQAKKIQDIKIKIGNINRKQQYTQQILEKINHCLSIISSDKKELYDGISNDSRFKKIWEDIGKLSEEDITSMHYGKKFTPAAEECTRNLFDFLEIREGIAYLDAVGDDEQIVFWTDVGAKQAIIDHQMQGKKIVADKDVPAINFCYWFARKINVYPVTGAQLGRIGSFSCRQLEFISASFAKLAKWNVVCFVRSPKYSEQDALSVGSFFWDNELPVLRNMQRTSKVKSIYVNLRKTGVDEETEQDLDNLDAGLVLFRKYRHYSGREPRVDENVDVYDSNDGKYFPFNVYADARPGLCIITLKQIIKQMRKYKRV